MDRRPKAYSYIRMSTDMQLKGDSLHRQVELSRKYAEEHGLELDTEFKLTDIGLSAYKGDNRKFGTLGRFSEAIENGEIPLGSLLLIEGFDRLSREEVSIALQTFFGILNAGIDIVTLADGQRYRSGQIDTAQLVMSIMIMARAHEESLTKSKRIAAAWSAKRSLAASKKLTKLAPSWLRLSADGQRFEVIAEHAKIVQRIFDDAAVGLGTYTITRRLNDEGVRSFGRAGHWGTSYINNILSNRAVLGECQPHRLDGRKRVPAGDVIEGYFPPIIDPELYNSVQYARHKRRDVKFRGRKGHRLSNLFTGIAKCGYCGSAMRYIDKGSSSGAYPHLRCAASLRGSWCVSSTWRYENFESAFLLFAKELDLASFVTSNDEKEALQAIDLTIGSQKEVIRQAENTRDRAAELIRRTEVAMDFVLAQVEKAQTELDAAQARLAELEAERSQHLRALDALSNDDRELIARLNRFDEEETYLLRTKLAARLRDLVASLRLKAIGERGHDAMNQAFLDQNVPAELAAIHRNAIEAVANDTLPDPVFEVQFTNGVTRTVQVSRSDPTKTTFGLKEQDGVFHDIGPAGEEVESDLNLLNDRRAARLIATGQ